MRRSTFQYFSIFRPALALIAVFFAQHVMAACLIEPGADKIVSVDANQGCANITDSEGEAYQGCVINNADGTCSFTFPNGKVLSVTSALGAAGAEWFVSEGSQLGVKAAIINGGAQGKNNCSYLYDEDAFEGFGGDLKTNGDLQNITGAFFCSDGVFDAAPPVATPMPTCNTVESGDPLDNTGIQCGSDRAIVCNFEVDEPKFGVTDGENCCVCNITELETCLEGDPDCSSHNVLIGDIIDTLGLPSPGAWKDARGVWHYY